MEFLDRSGSSILKAGWFGENKQYEYCKDIFLDDNERIVGFKSGRRGNEYARHYDF